MAVETEFGTDGTDGTDTMQTDPKKKYSSSLPALPAQHFFSDQSVSSVPSVPNRGKMPCIHDVKKNVVMTKENFNVVFCPVCDEYFVVYLR